MVRHTLYLEWDLVAVQSWTLLSKTQHQQSSGALHLVPLPYSIRAQLASAWQNARQAWKVMVPLYVLGG